MRALAIKTGDNTRWTPAQMIEDEETKQAIASGKKAMLIFLDDTERGKYETRWFAANLRNSEMIALLEIIQTDLVQMVLPE